VTSMAGNTTRSSRGTSSNLLTISLSVQKP
jgi:hypothetical protein